MPVSSYYFLFLSRSLFSYFFFGVLGISSVAPWRHGSAALWAFKKLDFPIFVEKKRGWERYNREKDYCIFRENVHAYKLIDLD